VEPIQKPKISVCVITYNQESYIRQCLQSIVGQEADFDFEVIVSDDCSIDGTRAIVHEFAERFPALIKATFQESHIGGTKNYLFTHGLAQGKYVAHIDGDDLMLPGKIRLQARYLENNPELVAVWHRVITIAKDGRISDPPPPSGVEPISQRLVLQRGFAGHHSSLMYRREKKPALGSFEEVLDFHISVELLKNGNGAILPNVLGGYRKGVGAQTVSRGRHTKLVKRALDYYLTVYPHYSPEINRLAFSLFVRESIAGHCEAISLFHTFLMSLNARTPVSVASECALMTKKTIAKLFSYFA